MDFEKQMSTECKLSYEGTGSVGDGAIFTP